ncbi:MAG: hypothetical protein ACTSXH_02890 [Promethearchaeota archaeon]
MDLELWLEVIEFLLAIGSILGLIGFIVGLLIMFFSGHRSKEKFIPFLLICLFLLIICGLNTGLRYFRINF